MCCFINLVFSQDQAYVLFRMDKVVAFEIANTFTGRGTKMSVAPGVIRPQLGCTVKITEKTGVR